MENVKLELGADHSEAKENSGRTWDDIKRELEIYWNSNPRYRENGSIRSFQFEESEHKQAGEWLL